MGKQIARVEGIVGSTAEKVYYYHDNLGSTRLMADKEGNVKWEQDYMPFGENLQKPGALVVDFADNAGYKFTGQREVAGIGLYYYGSQFYDPELGQLMIYMLDKLIMHNRRISTSMCCRIQ